MGLRPVISQKVGRGSTRRLCGRGTGDRLTGVVKLAAVVGSGEEGDQLALGKELVTVFNHLEKIEIQFEFPVEASIPGELCISSQSHVCEGTWPPPAEESVGQNQIHKRKEKTCQK